MTGGRNARQGCSSARPKIEDCTGCMNERSLPAGKIQSNTKVKRRQCTYNPVVGRIHAAFTRWLRKRAGQRWRTCKPAELRAVPASSSNGNGRMMRRRRCKSSHLGELALVCSLTQCVVFGEVALTRRSKPTVSERQGADHPTVRARPPTALSRHPIPTSVLTVDTSIDRILAVKFRRNSMILP